MSMGRRGSQQNDLFIANNVEAPGHRFYEALESFLTAAGFDRYVEQLCRRFYADDHVRGRHSVPPGVYFRMLLIGYFEGIESERGICWRCADSLSLKTFLGLQLHEKTPDHSTLSRTRTRLDETVYDEVFRWVLEILETTGLLKGKVVGVDSTYLRADAAMKSIVRRDTGEDYREYLKCLAKAAGIENPSEEELRRMDKKRKGKKMSNEDWTSPTDADARIMRLKDGRTRLSYKAEHVVDMETGAICAAELLTASDGDTATLKDSLSAADENLSEVCGAANEESGSDDDEGPDASGGAVDNAEPNTDEAHQDEPTTELEQIEEVVGDKGYHKAELLRELKEMGARSYIPEPVVTGQRHWEDKGGRKTAVAVYQNRQRVKRSKGRALQRRRGELIERSFAHICETGGHRRVRLRGRANANKRYQIQVAGYNLGLMMRSICGFGTPRGLSEAVRREKEKRQRSIKLQPLLWTLMLVVVLARLVRRTVRSRHAVPRTTAFSTSAEVSFGAIFAITA